MIIEKVIVHEIFQSKRGDDTEATVTDALVTLDDELEAFFGGRLVRTMNQAFSVTFEPDTDSPVPPLAVSLFRDGDFIEASGALAEHLQAAQPGNSPGGLLVAASGRTTQHDIVAIMKLEHESGVRSHLRELPGGRRVFEIRLEHELFLTENTKVFKAAILRIARRSARARLAPADVDVWLSDDQAPREGAPVARFFREGFLHCMFRRAPDIHTQEFHTTIDRFIAEVPDVETRVRYQNALITELNSNRPTINPRTFADDNFDVQDREPLLAALRASGVGTGRIRKDTDRIRTKLRRTAIRTERGAEVTGPPEAFESGTITVEAGAGRDDGDRIVIDDSITSVNGR